MESCSTDISMGVHWYGYYPLSSRSCRLRWNIGVSHLGSYCLEFTKIWCTRVCPTNGHQLPHYNIFKLLEPYSLTTRPVMWISATKDIRSLHVWQDLRCCYTFAIRSNFWLIAVPYAISWDNVVRRIGTRLYDKVVQLCVRKSVNI